MQLSFAFFLPILVAVPTFGSPLPNVNNAGNNAAMATSSDQSRRGEKKSQPESIAITKHSQLIESNPYRFNYFRKAIVPATTAESAKSAPMPFAGIEKQSTRTKSPSMFDKSYSGVLSSSKHSPAPAPAANNNERNWLLTKAWLIDNINRLRRELSELERDYTQNRDAIEHKNAETEMKFLQDISKLRADHTVLSQQQKQIIYLIKKTNQATRAMKVPSENDIPYVISKTKAVANHNAIKRQMKRDLTHITNSANSENFESETRRNMKEVFAEMSSLHDITLTLFDNLRHLERKIDTTHRN